MEIASPFLLGKIKETWLNPLPKDVASPYLVGRYLTKLPKDYILLFISMWKKMKS
jgi:hypothetical protein